ncbi:hypothetical protein PM082_010031 [Marasmius tenuissimus]|nr:hypothetical protein PM082_010031 [Marasmius tenuissimus]
MPQVKPHRLSMAEPVPAARVNTGTVGRIYLLSLSVSNLDNLWTQLDEVVIGAIGPPERRVMVGSWEGDYLSWSTGATPQAQVSSRRRRKRTGRVSQPIAASSLEPLFQLGVPSMMCLGESPSRLSSRPQQICLLPLQAIRGRATILFQIEHYWKMGTYFSLEWSRNAKEAWMSQASNIFSARARISLGTA